MCIAIKYEDASIVLKLSVDEDFNCWTKNKSRMLQVFQNVLFLMFDHAWWRTKCRLSHKSFISRCRRAIQRKGKSTERE